MWYVFVGIFIHTVYCLLVLPIPKVSITKSSVIFDTLPTPMLSKLILSVILREDILILLLSYMIRHVYVMSCDEQKSLLFLRGMFGKYFLGRFVLCYVKTCNQCYACKCTFLIYPV